MGKEERQVWQLRQRPARATRWATLKKAPLFRIMART
jgi:hypothetical protein